MTALSTPPEPNDSGSSDLATFDGQVHMNHIREALWDDSTNGAVVLVGAGFSRNARTRPPAEGTPPLWGDIALSLNQKLASPTGRDGESSPQVPSESIPRLAQEYEAAFGRPELHRHLRNELRDDDFVPGPRHESLMALPWRDVFTTNWDTLLEKTNSRLTSRHYRVVSCVEEIPLARSPRIVKLHGSLPSRFPLIVTEEDYRCYPTEFAAFVNMVQQAMLESVVCLIGFKGDDPNFLQWHGWVRDNLGSHAWKLYLLGWHDLAPHRRQMLEARNVIPVDLARHPQARKWPEQDRHRLATTWILRTLEYGRPYDLTDWPRSRSGASGIDPALKPVSMVATATPAKEPSPSSEERLDQKELASVLTAWGQNRVLYPGWLAVPSSRMHSMRDATDRWEQPILGSISELPFAEGLRALYELVWRRTILLDPPSNELQGACERIIATPKSKDLFLRGIHDVDATSPTAWTQWRTLVAFLLAAARLRFDQSEFDRLLALLEPFGKSDPQVHHLREYERALWAAYSLDHQALEALLEGWSTDRADTVWTMRKASLLLEINQKEAAERTLRRALNTLRTSTDPSQRIATASREAWLLCTLLGHAYRHKPRDISDTSTRWRDLGRYLCDAGRERFSYLDALRPQPEKPKATPFDLDLTVTTGFSWSSAEHERWRAAHRAVRLCEVVGLPPKAWILGVGAELMKAAADVLIGPEIELAARLSLRNADYDRDATLVRVFSRGRVAMMPRCVAGNLVELCNRTLETYAERIGRNGKRDLFAAERVRVAIECLSRLVVRLDPDEARKVVHSALALYGRSAIASDLLQHEPIQNLLSRSWEALSEELRREEVFSFLRAPILGLDGFAGGKGYADCCVGIGTNWMPPSRNVENEQEWKAVADLIVRGIRAGGLAKERAAYRSYLLSRWKRLTSEEAAEIAGLLWSPESHTVAELPVGTGLANWAFVFLPEPEPGLAERRLWAKWEHTDVSGGEGSVNVLEEISGLVSRYRSIGKAVEVPDLACAKIREHIESWAKDVSQATFFFAQSELDSLRNRAARALPEVLLDIRVSAETADLLYKKIVFLQETSVSGLPLVAGVLNGEPTYADDVKSLIRTCLAADSPQQAEGAVWGIFNWTRGAQVLPDRIPEIPEELVREIGSVIAIRRRQVLRSALDIAGWIVGRAPRAQAELVASLATQGLGFLLEELRYDRTDEDRDDVPALRRNCVRLAIALDERGWGEEGPVRAWISEAETDPLPEVRFARKWTRRDGNARDDGVVDNQASSSSRDE